jgi:hypothetical protein
MPKLVVTDVPTDEATEAQKAQLKSDTIVVAKKVAKAAVITTVIVVGVKLIKKYIAMPVENPDNNEDV